MCENHEKALLFLKFPDFISGGLVELKLQVAFSIKSIFNNVHLQTPGKPW